MNPTWWMYLIHIFFLVVTVYTAHHMVVFLAAFLFFLGFTTVTMEYQDRIKVKESLLVGFFLAGLVTLGAQQTWWLQPILASLSPIPLYLGATALTGITDNAALTYLGSLVEMSDVSNFVLSLQGSNPPNGKDPQGELYVASTAEAAAGDAEAAHDREVSEASARCADAQRRGNAHAPERRVTHALAHERQSAQDH